MKGELESGAESNTVCFPLWMSVEAIAMFENGSLASIKFKDENTNEKYRE